MHFPPIRRAVVRLLAILAVTASAFAGPPTRFSATVKGQGADVLLIPGLACPASVWDATVARLEKTRRVHVLQVAGFAGAPAPESAPGPVVAPLVEEIAAYIADEKLTAPAIIGHSLGGFTAMALAARHPEKIGRVLVVDSSPFFPLIVNPTATVESIRPEADALRDRLAHLPQAAFAATQEPILQRMIKDRAARTSLAALTGKSDPRIVAEAMHDLMTTDLRDELPQIQSPLTVLYAFDEKLGFPLESVDRLMHDAYAKAKSAHLIRIEGSYHFIMLDQPEKFAAAVDEFLK